MTDSPEGDLSTVIPGDLGSSIDATLAHLVRMRERERRIEAARYEAENQMLHRIGVAHRNGEIDDRQLIAVFEAYKALGSAGRMHRWDAHIDVIWKRMPHLVNTLPNGPEGTWVGTWPMDGGPRPAPGASVVYVLFDADNEPCYVGSTRTFHERMREHQRLGKRFVRWQAYPCRDREHAYELEVRLLGEHLPHLNRKVGR